MAQEPFTVAIPDETLRDLKERLKRTRFAPDFANDGWQYGTNLDFLAPGGGGIAGTPTTDRTGTDGDNAQPSPDGDYSLDFAGTSASAPIAGRSTIAGE